MRDQQQIEKHTLAKSILLHLGPGLLPGLLYFLIRGPLQQKGYPSLFALMLSLVFVNVPIILGYLLYKGKQKNGRYTLAGIISYRQPISVWQYLLWSLVTFVVIGLIFTVLKPVDNFLQEKLFSWVPGLDSGLDGLYAKSNLLITYIFVVMFGVLTGPILEELYFRGYLLPRVPGKNASLLHSILFAAYHVWTPWMIITRTIGLLPLIFAVKKKNIYLGIIVHILVNSIDAVMGFMFIASLS